LIVLAELDSAHPSLEQRVVPRPSDVLHVWHGKQRTPTESVPSGIDDDYGAVLADVSDLLESARRAVARSVNAVMTASYWAVGRRIVEEEQRGQQRADYGEQRSSPGVMRLCRCTSPDGHPETTYFHTNRVGAIAAGSATSLVWADAERSWQQIGNTTGPVSPTRLECKWVQSEW
jgi:hypothetical protein